MRDTSAIARRLLFDAMQEGSMENLKHIVQINILLGAWLIGAPFILGYSGSTVELANDIAAGVAVIACSWWILAGMGGQVGASVIQFLAGALADRVTFLFPLREIVARVHQ